jgi:hypothetical protein
MSALTDTDIIARAPGKVAAEIGSEAVILDIESGYYFQLNKTGSRIWALIEAPISLAALCEKLGAAFKVDAATCRGDVIEFVEQIRSKGLVTVTAS